MVPASMSPSGVSSFSTGSPNPSAAAPKRVGTLNGSFHCDEALGCLMIRPTNKFAGAEIVRTRDPQILDTLDVFLDVGGVYDPDRDHYDLYQNGFSDVFGHGINTKISSTGLVYKFIQLVQVPGGMVEGGKAKKEAASTEKGHDEVDGDELAPVTAEHDIELWPPISDLHIPREEGNNIEGPGTGDERCVEEVRDRTMELVHCSLAAVPEEREVDFKLPSLNTEHALSASGAGTEAVVDGKIMKGVGTKEMNGTDEVEMNRQGGMGRQIESNYVVEQSAVDWNRIERGVETLGQTVEYEKDEGGVMGERNTGNCSSVATPEENVIAIYHSFASVAPLESESERVPSSLTSEYASAVEDQSTGMTDNVSQPTAIIVETAGVVNFDNEVLYSEEMIWEQIYAMQTIVGYKSALNSSLVEELKALYLFTGVEPPISLRDTSDVMEIGDKLDFLKSVIGVK